MNRKATRLMVSSIGTKTWRVGPAWGTMSRTEGSPTLLSPAFSEWTGAKLVLEVPAGSRWTRIEDLY